jgi:hypothetical protein
LLYNEGILIAKSEGDPINLFLIKPVFWLQLSEDLYLFNMGRWEFPDEIA